MKVKFIDIYEKINIILKNEKLKEHQSEEALFDKIFEKYVLYCKYKKLPVTLKNIPKFTSRFKTFLKTSSIAEMFINNYFTNNWNDTFDNFYAFISKPKELDAMDESISE